MPDLQGTEAHEVLILNRVLWLPHYRLHGIYVSPDGMESTRRDLLRLGARIGSEQLWPRPRK